MKREYFGMIVIILFVLLIFLAEFIFGEKIVLEKLNSFIVIVVLVFFYIGQYSMRFPKAF